MKEKNVHGKSLKKAVVIVSCPALTKTIRRLKEDKDKKTYQEIFQTF